jgi:hypothetical protein
MRRALVLFVLVLAVGAGAPQHAAPLPLPERRVMAIFSHAWTEDFFRLAPETEYPWVREAGLTVTWRDVEPERGRFTWDALDATLARLERNGVTDILFTLDKFLPQWAGPTLGPPRDVEDWRGFVRAVAERYGDRIDFYQIWNEPAFDKNSEAAKKFNAIHFGGVFLTDYPPLLKASYEEIKRADPDSYVVCGSLSCDCSGVPELGTTLYEKMLNPPYNLQDWCDAFAVHPYYNPEDWGRFYGLVQEVLRREGVSRELVVTEIGWLHNIPDGLEIQRRAIGVEGIGALVEQGCRKFWVYEDLDDPPGETFDFYYGLFDYEGNPLPAWDSFKAWVLIFRAQDVMQPRW